ncbi:hypothetical protein BDB01DRAFT_725755 [Pilobolus umbonatus]|nr:hypothetical protein BDB01DRAFT_725755 [Pilobolus umbonatus]
MLLCTEDINTYAATVTLKAYVAQTSPSFPPLPKPINNNNQITVQNLKGYPPFWKIPTTDHVEVQKVYNSIDWSMVPNAPVRILNEDGFFINRTDGPEDPYCWWSSTNCITPKVSYLPPDIYTCLNKNDWGLNFDDGPFVPYDLDNPNAASENEYAEPALYNYLKKLDLQSTVFYIGSNVAKFPAAAKLALDHGHQICVHTWSHQPLTSQTNIQVVAEFYWSLRAIKEATGVTPKCWRPPQGDVDDRIRSIAYQMGMRNILWDQDTQDWNLPSPSGGVAQPSSIDRRIRQMIDDQKAGRFSQGLLVLEHEHTKAATNLSMHWLPQLKEAFHVIPALTCNGIIRPYWEENVVYPLLSTTHEHDISGRQRM